jgi:hypothetical protein
MLDDHFPEPEEVEPAYNVRVAINTSNEDYVGTRASEGTQSGKGAENYVLPGQVTVIFYHGTSSAYSSGKAVSAFRPYKVEVASSDNTSYILTGAVDVIPSEKPWRLAVLANVPDFDYTVLPFGTTSNFQSDTIIVQHTTFSWPEGTLPSRTNPIPMYGHYGNNQEANKLPQDKNYGYYYDLTGYAPNLIRAVAKIIVRSNEELGLPSISRCYTTGMAIPKGAYIAEGAFSSISDNTLNIPSETTGKYDNGVATDVPFSVLNDGLRQTLKYKYNYVLYVPEYRTTGTNADDIPEISFQLNGVQKSFKFGNYDADGKYTGTRNILRNYIYEYIITPSPYTIKYSVRPWDEEVAGEITFN